MVVSKQVNLHMSPDEAARMEAVRQRLQARQGQRYRVTYRIVLLEALDALEGYLDRIDKDRSRPR